MSALNVIILFAIFLTKIFALTIINVPNIADEPTEIKLPHFWKSTGFCPPKENVLEVLHSEDVKINMALIGALPNEAIKYIRVHWLLDLITVKSVPNGLPVLNFTNLDIFLDRMHSSKLLPIFEIMGNPSSYFTDFEEYKQLDEWYYLIKSMVLRYTDRYGKSTVAKWKFETWNEPDGRTYNTMNFTNKGFINYFTVSSLVLEHVRFQVAEKDGFKLGGPAGHFSDSKNDKCWSLIQYCTKSHNNSLCPLEFISFHRKGNETTNQVSDSGLQLAMEIRKMFPEMKRLPVANTEADILENWSKSKEWRGDVRYACMVIKVIADHFWKFTYINKIDIEVLSNDNAFLNYHPYYFTQRTLLTRFQMNNTSPPHSQFFKKPVYLAMLMLSFLGNRTSDSFINKNTTNASNMAHLFSYSNEESDVHETFYIFPFFNDTYVDNKTNKFHFKGMVLREKTKYVVYVLDNFLTNPFKVWENAGSPVFPNRILRERMRKVEGPFRIVGPQDVENNNYEFNMNYSIPIIICIHTCSKGQMSPGVVTDLKLFNVTSNEVLIIWSDVEVGTKCIKTYEIEFLPDLVGDMTTVPLFKRVNTDDVIFLSFQYVAAGSPKGEGTAGQYRVRAVDYWDRPGPYSASIRFPS